MLYREHGTNVACDKWLCVSIYWNACIFLFKFCWPNLVCLSIWFFTNMFFIWFEIYINYLMIIIWNFIWVREIYEIHVVSWFHVHIPSHIWFVALVFMVIHMFICIVRTKFGSEKMSHYWCCDDYYSKD